MTKTFKQYIKSKDMFGHTINLNFNKQGDTHQTFIGGFFSLFIKLAMATYVFLNLKKLWLYEEDSIKVEITKHHNINDGLEEEESYANTKMFIFHILRK